MQISIAKKNEVPRHDLSFIYFFRIKNTLFKYIMLIFANYKLY